MKISMIPNKIVKLIHASKGDTSLRKWAFEPYDNNGAINVSNIKDQLVYKTENGGTEQLLPVNTSTPTTSYFDGTINYGTDTDVEFTYKQSSYTGQARIKSIKGNTLVWNQLVNGMVTSSADGITTAYNSSTNVITITNNSRTTNYGTGSTRGNINTITITSGHKYLFCIDNVVTGVIVTHDTGSGLHDIPFNSTYTATTGTGNFRLRVTKDYDFVTAHPINSVVSIKIMCIDLTILNDSHITDYNSFKTYFPLSYYAHGQYLLNFNGTGIKTTGKNLFDKASATQGYRILNDGSTQASATYLYSDYIPVIPNKPYYISHIVGNSAFYSIATYDINKTFIKIVGVSGSYDASGQVTFDSGVSYIRFNALITHIDEIQLEFGSSASTYEPYTSSTLSLPISTYFPTGMKSASSVYDELSDKAITRVGSVDLGTLTWTYLSGGAQEGHERFNAGLPTGVKLPSATNVKANVECARYTTDTQSNVYNHVTNLTLGVHTNGTIQVYDSNYTDATTFKSAMSGVYLNYELATYTETDIKTASLVCKDIEVPCYLSSGNLVCDATEELTNESGFFDAKLKLKDSSSVAYSSKFKLHVEDL